MYGRVRSDGLGKPGRLGGVQCRSIKTVDSLTDLQQLAAQHKLQVAPTHLLINISILARIPSSTIMKFTGIVSALALLASSTFAQETVTVSYDTTYDNSAQSLLTVSCSNGQYGLDPPYSTFGDLPDFPYIGGAAAVAGWGSPNCGTCWQLQYTTPQGTQYTINVLAIDHTDAGFNIGLTAFNALVGGDGTFVGRVNAEATQVDKSVCGL